MSIISVCTRVYKVSFAHFESCYFWGFPGGSVVKNPPASSGDTGLIRDPKRSHMPWSK